MIGLKSHGNEDDAKHIESWSGHQIRKNQLGGNSSVMTPEKRVTVRAVFFRCPLHSYPIRYKTVRLLFKQYSGLFLPAKRPGHHAAFKDLDVCPTVELKDPLGFVAAKGNLTVANNFPLFILRKFLQAIAQF